VYVTEKFWWGDNAHTAANAACCNAVPPVMRGSNGGWRDSCMAILMLTNSITPYSTLELLRAQESRTASGDAASSLWGKDGFSFGDVLDTVNPLKHIPVVSALYEKATGDKTSTGSNLLGGALFGGVFGLAGSAVDEVVAAVTGESIGEHILGKSNVASGTTLPLSPALEKFAAEKSGQGLAERGLVGQIAPSPTATKGKSVADYMREAVNTYALQLQEQHSEARQAVG